MRVSSPSRTLAATAAFFLAATAATVACDTRVEGTTGVFRTSATLGGITLSAGTLSPAFSPSVTSYSAGVGFNTDQITVTPTIATPGSTVTVNGAPVPSGTASQPINLTVGSGNQIDVVVTNPDGLATRTYTITVTRSSF